VSKFERITDEFDERRCHHSNPRHQCIFVSVENTGYCPRHGGTMIQERQAKERMRMYYLKKWEQRVGEFSRAPEIKDLHEEIGIMRMMLEEVLNSCEGTDELILSAGKITAMVSNIKDLVSAVDKMDSRAALEPARLASLAQEWIKIICVYVTDEQSLKELSHKLTTSLEKQEALALAAPN